jgi:O-antigen/teichoic acid export membrane protein
MTSPGRKIEQPMVERRGIRSFAPRIPSSVRRDYVTTMAVDVLTLGSGLLLFHLIAQRASVDGFAYYQVARGLVATLQPLAMIGLVLGLQRYLPRAGVAARSLARQGFLVQVAVVVVIGILGFALAPDIGDLLGIGGGAGRVQAVFVALAGTCLWAISIAALRGTGQVVRANVCWVLGLGVVPIAAFFVVERIDAFLAVQGVGMIAVAVWGLAMAEPRADGGPPQAEHRPRPSLGSLVRYGIRRTPGDMALPALFAFPTFYVAGIANGGAEAGYVGFTTSGVTLICAAFGMLTPVLLPRLSGQFARTTVGSALWTGLRALPLAAVALAALATIALSLLAWPLVTGFLGDEFTDAVPILRLGLLAAIPLAAFYAARPTLDALQDSPVTVKLLVGCFALEVVLTYLGGWFLAPASAAVLGLCAGAGMLGVLSYAALHLALRGAAKAATRS